MARMVDAGLSMQIQDITQAGGFGELLDKPWWKRHMSEKPTARQKRPGGVSRSATLFELGHICLGSSPILQEKILKASSSPLPLFLPGF